MSLRLLCCSSSLDGGGSERQIWQLVTHLPRDQFDAQLYLLHRRGPYLAQLPAFIRVQAFSDLNFHSSIPGTIHRAQVVHLADLLWQEKFDVVYDRTYHMTLITSKACRQTNTPRVSVIVSPPSRDFAGNHERFRWFKYRALREAYSDPAAITLAVSQSVAEDAAEFYRIPLNRIQVIANPVDIEAVQQAAVSSSQTATSDVNNIDPPVLRLIVVGRMTEEKGHRLLLAALRLWASSPQLASLGHLQLDFVGDGPLRASLERLAVEMGIASTVRFCGFQANPYPWMAAADILCIPSLYEGLPNVALEAMALRKPVIATPSSGSLTELLGADNQRGVLLSEFTPECFVEAWKEHLTNPLEAARRAELAFEWISQHHAVNSWVAQMSQLLQAASTRHP